MHSKIAHSITGKVVLFSFLTLFTLPVGKNRVVFASSDSSKSASRLDVSLYTGIPEVGRLGESYRSLTEKTKFAFTPLDVTQDEALLKAGVVYGITFESLGAKVYFKRTGSCLILLEPPFKGAIKAMQFQIFDTQKPSGQTWDEYLIKEFGQPMAIGYGGPLKGDIFFYSWGDIEVSRIGLRRLALYRDKSIQTYRQNAGSNSPIKLFK